MKSSYLFRRFLLFGTFLFVLTGCVNNKGKEMYEDPPWLGGSIIETLESRGNFKILLELMERADYTEAIDKGLFTVFAASDSAYQVYFKSIGIESVDDLTEVQAFQLFTFNVLNTPRARQHLVYEYSYWHGGWQEEGSELGATLWRVPTRSVGRDYKDSVRYYSTLKGQVVKVQGQTKHVPLISKEFFKDFNGSPDGSDYTFFYPNTKWSGLQWHDANIVEAGVKCSNGFIYFIDRAITEIPNVDEYLVQNTDKFSLFYDIMQRFAVYNFSKYDIDKTRIYSKSYRTISNLVNEGGPPSQSPLMARRSSFTVFAPTNDVLQNYIDNTFLKKFESIDSVPEVSIAFLIQSCIKNTLDIPSKIKRGFVNNYGDAVDMDIDNTASGAVMTSNGPVYTMNKYFAPRAFTSTVGPVFFNNKNTTYIQAINSAQLISSLTSPELEVTIFGPTNDGLLEGGIRYFTTGTRLEYKLEDDVWRTMDAILAKSIVGDHIITDNLSGQQIDFKGEGFVKMNSNNYVYYNNNTLQGGGNQELGNVANIVETQKGDNGVYYALDNAILAPKNDPARFLGINSDLSEFLNLMYTAGLLDTIIDANTSFEYPNISFLLTHEYWTLFAPTNQAIVNARNSGQIPEDIDSLKNFINYHFVPDYVIFDDGKLNGIFGSQKIDSVGVNITYFAPVEIKNTKKDLTVVDKFSNNVKVNHAKANNIVKYGVVHKIDKVLLCQ